MLREYFQAMAEAENAVADFYATCCEFWPDEKIWTELAAEERIHSASALKMLELIEETPESFSLLKPLNITPVRLFIKGLGDNCKKVRGLVYNKLNAIAVSRDIEQSLLEARYDQLFSGANPTFKELILGLVTDTHIHKEKFTARLFKLMPGK